MRRHWDRCASKTNGTDLVWAFANTYYSSKSCWVWLFFSFLHFITRCYRARSSTLVIVNIIHSLQPGNQGALPDYYYYRAEYPSSTITNIHLHNIMCAYVGHSLEFTRSLTWNKMRCTHPSKCNYQNVEMFRCVPNSCQKDYTWMFSWVIAHCWLRTTVCWLFKNTRQHKTIKKYIYIYFDARRIISLNSATKGVYVGCVWMLCCACERRPMFPVQITHIENTSIIKWMLRAAVSRL